MTTFLFGAAVGVIVGVVYYAKIHPWLADKLKKIGGAA